MNEQQSYFLITRKLFDSPIWRDDPHILKLFIYLIGRARFLKDPQRFSTFDLNRGEIVTSLSEIANDNQYLSQGRYQKTWSRAKVSRMLTHLKKNGYIDILSDTYGTHISIRNYDRYQTQENYVRTPTLHQRDTTVTPAFIYKQDKNDKQDIKNKENGVYSKEFLTFWDAWPVGYKVAKPYCWKIWKKISGRPEIQTFLDALALQKRSEKWKNGYIPNPSTWLNQGRWEDDIPIPPTDGGGGASVPYYELNTGD